MSSIKNALLISLLAVSGCATVVNGRTEPLGLSSNPAGAEVSIDNGELKVITPTSVELKRDQNHSFVFHKDGYQDTSATVTSGTSGWVWGNLLAGGIIGGVVDFATGAAYKFSDDTLTVNMTPLPQVASAPKPVPTPSAPAAPGPVASQPNPEPRPASAVVNPQQRSIQTGDWEKQQ